MPPEPARHLLAEFASEHALLAGARQLRSDGRGPLELFSPIALAGTGALLAMGRSRIPQGMFLGAVLGGGGAYLLQWWTVAVAFPLRVAGMPLDSVPAFIPIAFESTILGACLVGVALVLIRCRLPRLWHPLFASAAFQRACRDRFFLAVTCGPADEATLTAQLHALGALGVETLSGDPA